MGANCAVHAAPASSQPSADDEVAFSCRCDVPYFRGRLPVADAAQGLPALFRPRKTTSYPWRENGTWQHINHALMMAAREAEGREANPTAGVIDGESVKTTKSGGPRGYDARKKVKGRKKQTPSTSWACGSPFIVYGASTQYRDGGVPLERFQVSCPLTKSIPS